MTGKLGRQSKSSLYVISLHLLRSRIPSAGYIGSPVKDPLERKGGKSRVRPTFLHLHRKEVPSRGLIVRDGEGVVILTSCRIKGTNYFRRHYDEVPSLHVGRDVCRDGSRRCWRALRNRISCLLFSHPFVGTEFPSFQVSFPAISSSPCPKSQRDAREI